MKKVLLTLSLVLFVSANAVQAQTQEEYEAALEAAVPNFAQAGSLEGVEIRVACRRLPAMDYIQNNAEMFESQTGAIITFTNYPENELRSQLVSDASSKAGGFDVYCLDGNYVPLFADNGWVRPIGQDIVEAYKLDDISESLRGLYSWKGELYGLPIYSEVTILYYRTDLLEAAGLEVPQTMEEFEAAAEALNNPPQVFGVALRGLRGEGMNVYTWSGWLRSYGGIFLDPEMNPAFNSPEAIEATQRYNDLITNFGPPGSGAWGWPEVSSAFAAGRVAMIVESSAFYPTFNSETDSSVVGNIGYALVPEGPAGRFPANYSIGMAIPSTVTDDAKYRAALAFLQWATSQEIEFARTSAGIGNQNRISVSESELLASQLDPAYIQAVNESGAITKSEYRPLIPQWREMGDIIGEEIGIVFTGGKSVEEALASAEERVRAAFEEAGILGTPRPVNEAFEGR
jgi:multiple sugar transport system substrate-binding protein